MAQKDEQVAALTQKNPDNPALEESCPKTGRLALPKNFHEQNMHFSGTH
jgi:hypothetical protein